MLFDSQFIEMVEESPIEGVVKACDLAFERVSAAQTDPHGWNEEEHAILWEAASFVELVLEENSLHIKYVVPEAKGDISVNSKNLFEFLQGVRNEFEARSIALRIESYKGRYRSAFKSAFAYEFSQGDFDRIQLLVNELRDKISSNEMLESDHKRRLLKRLEKLQSELHKRVADLDRFWGMVGDAGVVLGKLGNDSKPIVDRIKELAEIVWRTQARTEELPSNSPNPMLDDNSDT